MIGLLLGGGYVFVDGGGIEYVVVGGDYLVIF